MYRIMNNRYILRKNYSSIFYTKDDIIRGKLAFKTKIDTWLNTESPVVILVSIDSAFHKPIDGDLKMNALIATISSHVQDKITVLMADHAHLQTTILNYHNDETAALEASLKKTNELVSRYQFDLLSSSLVYWHSFICSDINYHQFLNLVKDLYTNNPVFQNHLQTDIENAYTEERKQKYTDEEVYRRKAKEDIFEQCACLLVLAEKGYRFLFYPGPPLASTEYMMRHLLSPNKQIEWVDVFLSIEKKTKSTKISSYSDYLESKTEQ